MKDEIDIMLHAVLPQGAHGTPRPQKVSFRFVTKPYGSLRNPVDELFLRFRKLAIVFYILAHLWTVIKNCG